MTSIYSYPPVDGQSIDMSVMGNMKKLPPENARRAWDNRKRPVQFEASQFYGFPHYFATLKEADNPYLDYYGPEHTQVTLCWIEDSTNDPEGRGKTFYSGELDTYEQALKWGLQTYKRYFDDNKHTLLRQGIPKRVKISEIIPREGD